VCGQLNRENINLESKRIFRAKEQELFPVKDLTRRTQNRGNVSSDGGLKGVWEEFLGKITGQRSGNGERRLHFCLGGGGGGGGGKRTEDLGQKKGWGGGSCLVNARRKKRGSLAWSKKKWQVWSPATVPKHCQTNGQTKKDGSKAQENWVDCPWQKVFWGADGRTPNSFTWVLRIATL